MTIDPRGAGRPTQPGDSADPPNPRVKPVNKGQMMAQLNSMPQDQGGLLIVSPVGTGNPDDYAQLALFTNPHHSFKGSASFIINARTDSDFYDLLDLNSLPPGVEVAITVTTPAGQSTSRFRGTEGNIQG